MISRLLSIPTSNFVLERIERQWLVVEPRGPEREAAAGHVQAHSVAGAEVPGDRAQVDLEQASHLDQIAKGVVRGMWRGVKVPGHAEEVLAAAQALG